MRTKDKAYHNFVKRHNASVASIRSKFNSYIKAAISFSLILLAWASLDNYIIEVIGKNGFRIILAAIYGIIIFYLYKSLTINRNNKKRKQRVSEDQKQKLARRARQAGRHFDV